MIIMGNHRLERLSEDAKREIASIVRELKDPRVPELISVTNVHLTPDLKYAKVFVSMLGDEKVVKEALKGLNAAAGFVRRELAHRIEIRYTPEITFVFDDSIEHGAHISKLLNQIMPNNH
jgi:ribosome-binding factor A